ncbi:efflux RND transporter periplasmic adaptor subunit [Labilibaculum antarcticum]|uniref:Lipoprotein n=1 Tax=Labilibaculum antarcticum TaxID=1717717 RepID=A0A1Y1CGF6_9BACT|nr:hypothetical protein [Labilibaculum antarcticum]BAX79163.1 hypothetical protein ALGA_0774 [Labilibaculum antarcticum]
MKLKFLSLGLLALSFVACDSYEESDSVAAMRNARAEVFQSEAAINLAKATFEEANAAFRNAEVAYKNFEAALLEAEVKAAQLANAKTEALDAMEIATAQADYDYAMLEMANDKVELANALMSLENAKIVLDGQKLQAEYAFSVIANGLVTDKNDDLNTAFGLYTGAYGDWDTATNNLLDANADLVTDKYALAGYKYAFDNMDVQGDKEAEIALLKTSNAEYVASLKVVSDLKATNDWDAFIASRDAKVAEKLVAVTIQTNMTNADVASTMVAEDAAAEAADKAATVADDAADAVTAAGDVVTAAYDDITTWVADNAGAASSFEKGIYLTVSARQNGLDAAKDATSAAKDAMDAKQDELDADDLTTYETELLEEELAALTEDYNDKKAISDAFEATFDAEVEALNEAFADAKDAEDVAGDLAKDATDAKDAADVVATDAATAADAATTAEAEAISVIKTEIDRLNALVFIYNTSTAETTSATLGDMTDNIDDAIEALEEDIKDVEDDIYAAEKTLAEIVAGDYGQAEAVRDQELAIVKAESNIETLKLLVAEAKADLDARQAEYNALLED